MSVDKEDMILSLETSTSACSVALYHEQELLGYSETFMAKSHSEILTIMIRNLLEQSQVKMQDLQAVAVSKGPGSYTGLRIGISAAKGLCFAFDIPLYAVDTLQSMAQQIIASVSDQNALFCPMLDARRMEVYTALFRSDLSTFRSTEALILDENTFSEALRNHQIHFFGNGASKFEAIMTNANAIFWESVYPSAKYIGKLVSKNQYQEVSVAYFEPFYLKPFFTKPSKKMVLGKNLPITHR